MKEAPIPPPFLYVGAKVNLARSYPRPRHSKIIEPFAGSGGYACLHGADRDVLLVDKSERVVSAWQWLIGATRSDVMALPALEQIPLAGLHTLDIPQGAKDLIGLTLCRGTMPADKPTPWAIETAAVGKACFWTRRRQTRLAGAVHLMSHWQARCSDYHDAPDEKATWFVDPPYQAGRLRRMYPAIVDDYERLGIWCRTRAGQVIACDTMKADWLPFRPLEVKGYRHRMPQIKSDDLGEAVWLGGVT